MTNNISSVNSKEAIRFAWEQVKNNLGYFIGLMLVAGVVFVLPSYLSELLAKTSAGLSALVALAAWVLQIGVGLGLMGLALKFCDGIKPPLAEIFNYFHFFWRYFLASLLYGLIILAGLILLVVPAFVWGVKYSLFPYFIIDKNTKPLAALQLSADATQGVGWQLFLFLLLLVLINLAGALALGVGLLITMPMTYLAWAYVYRQLSTKVTVPVAAT